jgi:hypothetical protein
VGTNSIRIEVEELEMWTISARKILPYLSKKVKHFFRKSCTNCSPKFCALCQYEWGSFCSIIYL